VKFLYKKALAFLYKKRLLLDSRTQKVLGKVLGFVLSAYLSKRLKLKAAKKTQLIGFLCKILVIIITRIFYTLVSKTICNITYRPYDIFFLVQTTFCGFRIVYVSVNY
jgi:hypothetical protein